MTAGDSGKTPGWRHRLNGRDLLIRQRLAVLPDEPHGAQVIRRLQRIADPLDRATRIEFVLTPTSGFEFGFTFRHAPYVGRPQATKKAG